MASVFERLRDALAPDYQLERELGGGGMGVVFLAREVALDRRVAIKIIRPELATARATERFLREARMLARLKHPSIMPVHRAGEAGGFAYYVMDYCEGETLQQRLEGGSVTSDQAVRLGRQLLEGLEAVHRAGLVHRDIKPANVFLLGDRAVLGDFGLAVPEAVGTSTPTEPAGFVGTPGYTPPEQAAGGRVTARTDLYAMGVVLYEAITARRWYAPAPEDAPDWSRIPPALRSTLRRALAWSPERRWRDAASFRRALSRGARRREWWSWVGGGAVVLVGLVGWALWPRGPAESSVRLVRVRALDAQGLPDRPALGDSLARLVVGDLDGNPDFVVLGPQDTASGTAVELRGTLRADAGSLCAEASLRAAAGRAVDLAETCAPAAQPVDLADSLARLVLLALWTGEEPLIADLPRNAVPRTARGVAAWVRAERLFAQGRWGEAYGGYLDAERADTTCWLCLWRLYFVENWESLPHDEDRFRRFVAHIQAFPPQYRSVMRASTLPIPERLDTLHRVTQQYPHFFFGWWFLGEEQFHRAPLIGRRRGEALESFVRAAELGPAFAPAWEHLAFVATTEGDSSLARRALDQWASAMGGAPRDTISLEIRAMGTSSFAWRFRPGRYAQDVTRESLLRPEILASPNMPAGPRMMTMFDAPEGAVWLGGRLAEMRERRHVARSGLLAQAFGYVLLGRPDSARARLDELLTRYPEPELVLFTAEYTAALAHLDSAGVPSWREFAEGTLARLAGSGGLALAGRERATGMLAVLSGSAPARGEAGEFAPLLEASALARRQRWREALGSTAKLVVDPAARFASPVLRALVHLDRADWWVRLGDPDAAARELRWAEHWQVEGFPSGPPQAADVDWSLRALARWRLAATLDRANHHDEEVCLAYVRAARAWAGGSPVFSARADSARRRAAALHCPAGM